MELHQPSQDSVFLRLADNPQSPEIDALLALVRAGASLDQALAQARAAADASIDLGA